MRLILCALLIMAGLMMAGAPVVLADGVQLPVLTGGAISLSADSYPPYADGYRWPGTYFEARFKGTSVNYVVEDYNDILQVSVDGNIYALETTPGGTTIPLGPFADGEHLIRVDMRTESFYTMEYFVGFTVPAPANVLPAPTISSREIEFIGDSYTAGYADLSNSTSCQGNTVFETTDTPQAFGPLTANHYGADYRINAITGLGMVRNYAGELPGQAMSEEYDFSTAGPPWSPQIIAIMLGQNDFSTALNPGEAWNTSSQLETSFQNTYVAFVEKLRALHPNSYFILMAADATALAQTQVQAVLAVLKAAPYNETRIGYLAINGLSYGACDFHPTQADHLRIEQDLIGFIDAVPNIWQVKSVNAATTAPILWQNSNGDVAAWFMNGGTISTSANLGVLSADWSIQGTGDFNRDGNSDILWRNATTGDVVIWLMNGGTITSSTDLGVIPSSWTIAGTADFNGDGTTDILWRNASGDVVIWLMNGGAITSSADLGVISPDWTIAGTGDFNGDGRADILWRNANGDVVTWFMNAGTIASSADLGNIPGDWVIQRTGDFNADGTSDILWRNTSGDLVVWFMSGGAIASSADLGLIPLSWTIQGTGDFDGDGKTDILWRNSSGDVVIWFMNSGAISSSADLGIVPASWTIQAVGQ